MDEIDILLSHSFEEIKRGNLIITLLKLTQQYLGLPYTNCEKEYFRYYEKLKALKNKPMADQKDYLEKKYILRPGHLLYYNSTHFNNDTLTDEIAASAIKKFPALINSFLDEKEMAILKGKSDEKKDEEVITESELTTEPESELEPEPKLVPKKKPGKK